MTVTIDDIMTIKVGQTKRFDVGSANLCDSARTTVSWVNSNRKPADVERFRTTSDRKNGIIWVTAIKKENTV